MVVVLAGAVNAHHQSHERFRGRHVQGLLSRRDDGGHLASQRLAHCLRGRLFGEPRLAQALDDAPGHGNAKVGGDQHLFEFRQRGTVQLAPTEDTAEAAPQ